VGDSVGFFMAVKLPQANPDGNKPPQSASSHLGITSCASLSASSAP
jgi:hypothetical protein